MIKDLHVKYNGLEYEFRVIIGAPDSGLELEIKNGSSNVIRLYEADIRFLSNLLQLYMNGVVNDKD